MSEEIKKEQPQAPEKKLFARPAGIYDYHDGKNITHFIFPSANSLAENYAILSFIRDEIWKALEAQKKAEKQKDEKEKAKEDKKEVSKEEKSDK